MRWNNVIRTRPPDDRKPEFIEIESCRPSVVADIVATKPVAIFGFGNIPLEWATTYTNIVNWRGRRMPVNIGGHVCWYYPMYHPNFLLDMRRKREKGGRKFALDNIATEDERAFYFDLKRAFKEIKRGLPKPIVHNRADAERGVETITSFTDQDVNRIMHVLKEMAKKEYVGFDYETNAIRPYNNGTKILSVGVSDGTLSFSFPIYKREAKWTQLQLQKILFALKEFLYATPMRKVVHNLAFEMEWSAVKFEKGVLRSGFWDDSMAQAVTLDERTGGKGKGGCLSLDFLVQQYFGFALKALSNLDRKHLDKEPIGVVLNYNAMDAKYHLLLFLAQKERLEEAKLTQTYARRLRRIPTCVLTQIKGVPVVQEEVQKLWDKYEARATRLEATIAQLPTAAKFRKKYGEKFKPMSNDHVTKMFRDMQGRDEGYTKGETREDGFVSTHPSKSQGYTVDKDVLDRIGTKMSRLIVELRETKKRLKTYIAPMMDGSETVYDDGLMHPTLNTVFSEPGRTSSEGPNVQNYPKRDGEAKEVRKPVKCNDDEVFVAFDQGQIQARIIAMASKDPAFTKSLWERYDVHMEWAERIAKEYPRIMDQYKDKEKPMKAFRGDVKNQWTFPLFFGAQIKSVAEYLHIPEHVAKILVEEFWDMFHGVRDWQEELRKFYHKFGYVKLLTGARVRAPLSFNEMINYPIQGTEAEIVLDCHNRISEMESNLWDRSLDVVDISKRFRRLATQAYMPFQPSMMIHDDLTFRLPVKNVDQYAEIIVPEMLKKTFPFINVPLTVEMSVGRSWYDLEEVENFSSDQWYKTGEGGW